MLQGVEVARGLRDLEHAGRAQVHIYGEQRNGIITM